MSSSTTETVDVCMPQMGVSVAEGTLVEWRKQVGDWVEADEVICAISTDKIDTDVEAPATGRVSEIRVDVGETVEVGAVLATISTDARPGQPHVSESSSNEGTSEAEVAMEAAGEAGELQGDTADEDATPASAQSGAAARPGGRRKYSPVVMRMAAEHDLDLSQIEGTGRDGRVRKQDVLAFLESGGGRVPRRRSRRCTSSPRTSPTSRCRRASAHRGSPAPPSR